MGVVCPHHSSVIQQATPNTTCVDYLWWHHVIYLQDYLKRQHGTPVKLRFPAGFDKTHRRTILNFLEHSGWIQMENWRDLLSSRVLRGDGNVWVFHPSETAVWSQPPELVGQDFNSKASAYKFWLITCKDIEIYAVAITVLGPPSIKKFPPRPLWASL